MLKFQFSGVINYDVGSCHDAREVRFCKAITAPDMESAVKKAKEIIKLLHRQYRSYTDYCLNAELVVVGAVWKTFRE